MSRALQVTAANIRHHLKVLKSTGLVEVVGKQPGRSRGRPMQLYSLTENALKNNLVGLANAVLQAMFANTSSEREPLNRIARQLMGDYQPAPNIHFRISQVIEELNHLQYQASWEASPNGPRVIFRNCPYAIILDEHPKLCRLDEELLSVLLDYPVRQTAKLERTPEGAPHCAFIAR
jgi:predicted ArsR family transcriptional regulator